MKLVSKILVVLLMISLTSCGTTNNNVESKKENIENGKSHESKGSWKKDFYVDEFGDKTSEALVYNTSITGKFSNSATTNSKCTFGLSIDDENVTLIIFEYGNLQVKGEEKYTCKLRADNGDEESFDGEMRSDRVFFDGWGDATIINCLKENQKFKLYLEEKSKYGTPSTYLCEIEADNFNDVYWK